MKHRLQGEQKATTSGLVLGIALFGLFLSLLGAPAGRGQTTTTATAFGTVLDASGASVADAQVTVTNAKTGVVRTTQSNATGEYTVTALPAGSYAMKVEKTGFEAATADITLLVSQQLQANFSLHPGAVTTQITVEAQAEMTQTSDATLGNVIDQNTVTELPLNGRQYTQLALLSPGVTTPATGGFGGSMEQSGVRVTINGGRIQDVNYTLDGFSITDYSFTNIGGYPPLDAVQEFKVVGGLYDATSGYKASGQVNAITKSGTNSLHGSVYEYFRNSVLDSRNYFDPVNVPPYRQNQFGFSVGGPIDFGSLYNGKDHTFFFASYEGLRIGQSVSRLFSVPTAAMRTGNLSALGKTITNPLTSVVFPGAVIPSGLIDPLSTAVLQQVPLPNLPGISNNFLTSALLNRSDNNFVIKLDHNVGKNQFSFRFFFSNIDQLDPTNGGAELPGFGLSTVTDSRNGAFSFTRVISSSLVNQLHVGFSYISGGQFLQNRENWVGTLGITGNVSTDPREFGFPMFSTTQFSGIGESTTPFNRSQTFYGLSDNLNWVKGNHTITIGGDLLFLRWLPFSDEANRGSFTYNGRFSGNGFSDFLLGYPSLASGTIGDTNGDYRSRGYSLYASDSWRIRPNFTINVGLRWEYDGPIYSARNRWSNVYFNPATRQETLLLASSGGQVDTKEFLVPLSAIPIPIETSQQFGIPTSLVYTDKHEFSPRFGFAWSPFGSTKTVIRSGYGIYYSTPELGAHISPAFTPPFVNFSLASQITPTSQTKNILATGAASFSPLPYNISGILGYVQQWGLDWQQQLTPTLLLDIGYVGSKGTHLELPENQNVAVPGTGAIANRKPNPAEPTLFVYGNPLGGSSYNALQVQLRKRISNGVTFTGNYSFSHSLDNVSSPDSQGPQNPANLRAEWGPSAWDRRHILSFNAVYEFPFGRGRMFAINNKALNTLFGDWQLSGLFEYSSGARYSVIATALDPENIGSPFGSVERPNLIGVPNFTYGQRTPKQWFNRAAFQDPATPAYGTEGKGDVIGPSSNESSVALVKTFHLYRESNLQFRGEVFNIFNHPNFAAPNLTFGSGAFGTIASANESRLAQFALKFLF